MPLTLHGIGTAVPAQRLSQQEALAVAHRINGGSSDKARLMDRIYRKTTVLSRGSVLLQNDVDHGATRQHLSFYGADSPGTAERMQVFDEHAGQLALMAARAAVNDCGFAPSSITHLVTVSCTGFQSPGVDLFLIDQLGL